MKKPEELQPGFSHALSPFPLPFTIPIELSSDESHHLKNVLRLKEGERVEIYDLSSASSFHGVVESTRNGLCKVSLDTVLRSPLQHPRRRLTLVMGLIKPEDCDLIVEKCTELGTDRIVFFSGERSQYSLKGEKAQSRLQRWEKIVRVALKQSYSPVHSQLSLHSSLVEALSTQPPEPGHQEQRLLMHPPSELPTAPHLPEQGVKNTVFFDLHQELALPRQPPLQNIQEYADSYIIVGPEGGLTVAEVGFAKSWGYKPCTFSGNVLRAETAAIVSCGIFRSLY